VNIYAASAIAIENQDVDISADKEKDVRTILDLSPVPAQLLHLLAPDGIVFGALQNGDFTITFYLQRIETRSPYILTALVWKLTIMKD
jgi:hypothetical protein